MIKIAGSIFLFAACAGLGFWKSQQCQGRINQIKILMHIADCLKGEITFASSTLVEALERIGGKVKPPFAGFLCSLACNLRKSSGEEFSEVLEQTMKRELKDTCLWKEDLEAFYQTVSSLGYLDKQMQIHLLDRYLKEQGQKMELLMTELPGKRKLFRSLGILGGAFFVILLL
ncbi:MAG: hypothetical protein EOM40_01765 [Clostridia bacterium]|nr:hypothetical protein [Clostridia bacterium]NCC44852.1 hypothetical protein [Clostridia bacterium]